MSDSVAPWTAGKRQGDEVKRFIAVVVILVLTGCSAVPGSSGSSSPGGGSTASAPPGSASPGASESAPASGQADVPPFVETSGECKPDAEATGMPTFFPTKEGKLPDGAPVVISHGLFANKENELFRIDVIGLKAAAVDEYATTVLVCLDYEPSEAGGPSQGEGVPEKSGDGSQFGEESPADLIIVASVVGVLGSKEKANAAIEELGAIDPSEWLDRLEKNYDALPPVEQPYLINSIFDPKAKDGATHHYAEVKSTKVWAKITSMDGSVKAGLCRGAGTDPYKTVSVNNGTTRNLYASDDLTWSYDLSVRGNLTGRYRVAKQDGWPGWYRGFFSDPPTDSQHTCKVP
jgi:hypothetical protein